MKKTTNINIFKKNRRCSSAGMFNTSSAGAVTSLIFVVVLTLIGACGNAYADDPPSLTINVDNGSGGTDLNMDLMFDDINGTFKASNDLNISVSTTNIIGYTLGFSADGSISGNTGNASAALINTTDSSKKVPSITGLVSAADFSAAGSTGAVYNNKWGYKPSKFNSSDNNTNYYPAPNTNGDTLDVTAVSSESPNTYTISFGTRIDGSVTPGSYNNTFIITAVANFAQYGINYYAGNGSSDASLAHMPTNETGYITDEKLPISKHIPTRDSYGFIGWCLGTSSESNITTNNGVDSCSSTVYLAGKNVNVDVEQYSDTTYYLYAMWSNGLYDKVSSLVKRDDGIPRTQSLADMQAVITEPTSSEPLYDTSNSGVYAYDAATFGTASDASNDYPIYYYRGWLDENFAESDQYGGIPSTGDSGYYPNYVRLSDTTGGKTSTCWRIVRTTGAGGIKMIYNGVWTGNTCANSGSSAVAGTTYFNRGAGYEDEHNCNADNDACGTMGFITLVGYNYNSTYASDKTATSAINNSIVFNNETPSNARIKTEEWYTQTSNLSPYNTSGKLEISAGWCDDRTTTAWPSISDTTIPYAISWVAFGATRRNDSNEGKLSLTCLNSTGNDLLVASDGINAPLAPLTMDELALAGSGRNSNKESATPNEVAVSSSNFSYGSYLRSSGDFWTLSPSARGYDGLDIYTLTHSGRANVPRSIWFYGIRPTISLVHASRIDSGSGTANDPWVIDASADTDYTRTMQNVNEWGSSIPVGGEVTTTDTRDGNQYTVARLCTNYASGNNCTESQLWMTQNLDLDIGGSDGHGGTMVLDSTNTDINVDLGSSAGYSTDNNTGVIAWSPSVGKATINSWNAGNNDGAVLNWQDNTKNPYQAEGNDHYVYATNSAIYSSMVDCKNANHTEAQCLHYKVGNYYNWSASVASNDTNNYTAKYTVANNSICPKGWRLPKGLTNNNGAITQSEVNKLLSAQGVAAGTDLAGGNDIKYTSDGFSRIITTGIYGDPLYYMRSGYVNKTGLNNFSWDSGYCLSGVIDGSAAYRLIINSGQVFPAGFGNRSNGVSVRCVSDY